MRPQLFAIAALAVAMAGPAAGQAYDPNYPVCIHYYGGRFSRDGIDCSYTSIQQCQSTASGLSAMCSENPFYAPRRAPQRLKHRSRHPVQ